MPNEIERKYLMQDHPGWRQLIVKSEHLLQGYLAKRPVTVRLRIVDGLTAFLTLKSETGAVDQRLETEVTIPATEAWQHLNAAQCRVLEKTRHHVPFQGKNWTVDEFHGQLAGLLLAEIEGASSEEVAAAIPPPGMLRDVTEDSEYTNAALSDRSNQFARLTNNESPYAAFSLS